MSHKKTSRSIINFSIFNKHVAVKDTDIDKTHVASSDKYSLKNRNRTNEEIMEHEYKGSKSPIPNSYSTTGSDLEGILNLSTKLSGLSSSSSLSWSEDYEVEITRKVQLELEKLDKAFQGIGDVPPPHDKDEITEWKHLFPSLCILAEKTPTNSTENSEASSESDDDTLTVANQTSQNPTSNRSNSVYSRSSNILANKRRTEEQAQNFLNASRSYHTLPRKPSLEIEKYLKISSFRNPDMLPKKQNSQPLLIRQSSKDLSGDASPDYTSLPFITATSLKTQIRKPSRKNPKLLTLPPIANNFRSISATPRQASSKSMFVSMNFKKDSSAKGDQISLKSDLMKLFDLIPLSNR